MRRKDPGQGDLPELARRLRALLTAHDSVAYDLEASYGALLGSEIEAQAVTVRRLAKRASDEVFRLVKLIEDSPPYRRAVRKESNELPPKTS